MHAGDAASDAIIVPEHEAAAGGHDGRHDDVPAAQWQFYVMSGLEAASSSNAGHSDGYVSADAGQASAHLVPASLELLSTELDTLNM